MPCCLCEDEEDKNAERALALNRACWPLIHPILVFICFNDASFPLSQSFVCVAKKHKYVSQQLLISMLFGKGPSVAKQLLSCGEKKIMLRHNAQCMFDTLVKEF